MSGQNPRSSLQGAARQNAHPRLHALSKPYSRPSSFSGLSSSATMTDLANVSSSLGSPSKSPTKSSTTRPGLSGDSRSSSFSSLPRSGSDSSLFSGIKSIFSRPLQWLATPTRDQITTANKRDSFSSFGHDLEDPDSPSETRNQKRIRRSSPSPEKQKSKSNGVSKGHYEPEPEFQVQGRAVSGFMLPPLSPNVTLKPKSHLPQHMTTQNPTNFSRPLGSSSGLSSSKSMSYLDPPSDVLGSSSPRKGGMLTRSKRVELSSLVDDDDRSMDGLEKGKGKEEEKTWSPWKSRYSTAGGAASSAANVRPTTPSRKTPNRLDSRDFALPSLSPFKPPPSPLHRQSPHPPNLGGSTSGLTRSATTANIRRAASVASDVSMSGGLTRSGSVKGLRQSGSMLFGSVNGDREGGRDDDRMSVDGEQRQREGSVLDWFMKDRWDGRATSPASVAASRRLGSAGPSSSHPPIRKGQLVWHEEEKAFVRESDLRLSQAPPAVHKSEAERILHTLESMRKTPLTDARKGDVPPLIGQSSRTMRKTINVPLATAAAGDSAKQRRDKDRLGGDDRVSVMISPYGRRKVADQQVRDDRRSKMAEDRDYRPSPTPTASDARSRSHSRTSDVEMDRPSSSQKSLSPAPAPTPRRSSRLKKPSAAEEIPTPKANRRTKRGASKQPETMYEEEHTQRTPKGRKSRKQTVDRGTSPDPAPPVPTITATAPSPGGPANADSSTQTVSNSNYQPLADGERSRGGSSLRARSDVSKRTHVGAASYSRSVTPSSGRFSAREEDLPDMDELEQAKIPLPSFSGISFAGLNANPPASNGDAAQNASQSSAPAAAQPSSSLGVPSQRKPAGPLARVGLSSTRPRASSPLAGGSIVAQPESPPTAAPPARSTEPAQPPANGFFTLNGSTPTVPSSTTGSTTALSKPAASSFFSGPSTNGDTNKEKTFSFGLGQPPANPAAAEPEKSSSGGIPDFFGKKSVPPSGTTTPTSIPAFDFGLPKKSTDEPKAPPAELPSSTFSFGKPAEAPKATASGTSSTGGFSFGAPASKQPEKTAAAVPSFSFGSFKPAEPAKSTFNFGASSASSSKPAESARPTFSFGTPSSTAAAEKPAEATKPAFSFGTSSIAPAKTAEPAKPAFSFGNTSASAPAAKVAEPAKPAFSFGTPTSNATTSAPASSGFSFGKPAEKKDTAASNPFGPGASSAATSTPSFNFGASSGTKTFAPFGSSQPNGDVSKSNPFGASPITTPAAASASSGFNFGASAPSAQPNGASSGFGSTAPAAQASNPFGSANTSPALGSAPNPFGQTQPSSPALASAAAPSFSFGQSSSTPTTGFGSSAPAATTGVSNPFGQTSSTTPAATPASAGFNFSFGAGSTSNPAPAPNASGFGGFGQQANTTPSTPNTNSSFAFGAAPQPSTPTTSQSFAFGASTTPSIAPSSGFSFGAPTNNAQQQAPRFGSPAPADGGGFSLGANDGGAPGSPGGRKVKGLPRRGAVKR
ncbi:uncharacterized protein I206_106504 [Kwoniella pini CBS 10737]|uniref:Uncharacterized protein n=1 Tax=Kwoniella pini CBS 10737 TaxID=1296096 RepID=A0A1B9HUH7_9TREE|nr:uncharacterized protein I206_07309 [Kwoniella pini CBS 10737]OCF46922.1 hypothetical protein I206_07309 [Kwoniella pini CBS 10737]